jgi:hypothetical protein
MAAKKKAEPPKAELTIQPESGETRGKVMAGALMRPSVQAACTIRDFEKSEVNLTYFVEELTAQIEAVNGGDLTRAEGILITQAHTLNELFNSLARRSCKQEHLKQYETYLRLALKAQSQCRATLETLAAIKNPPIVYAKQANFANGPQQVNNGVPASPPPTHAREEKTIQSNELLKDYSHETEIIGMDTGTTRSAGGADPQVETVGALVRAKHG